MKTQPNTSRGVVTARRGLALKVAVVVVTVVSGCSAATKSTNASSPPSVTSVAASESSTAAGDATPQRTVIVDDLSDPTQFVDGPNGWLLVAQLNGEEDASTGQILAVNLKTKQRVVLLDKLNKPTGVAWFNGFLWVMEQRRLVRSPWADPTAKPGPIEVLVDELPFNGRSEGTLTVTPTSHLLYETTGSIVSGSVVDGSGVLWEFDPSTKTSSKFAVGLKNSYAHTFLPDGRLATVDIGDNIATAPVDELNLLPSESTDNKPPQFGWPDCPGDTTCADVIAPLTTFPPHSTPSGVAANKQYAYVTLFVTGQLQRVALKGQATNAAQTTIASELQGPHTVMLRPNGQLWISEHLANRIISITPPR